MNLPTTGSSGGPPQPPSPMYKSHGIMGTMLEPTASSSGTIACCLQGLITTSTDESCSNIYVEIIQNPDSTKKTSTTTTVTTIRDSNGDIACAAELSKSFTMGIVFSYQQLRVVHLKFNIFGSKSVSSNFKKIGEAFLDISSLVSSENKPMVVVLPVTKNARELFDCQQTGWLLFGCTYQSSTNNTQGNQPLEFLQKNISQSWSRIMQYPRKYLNQWLAAQPEGEAAAPKITLHLGLGQITGCSSNIESSIYGGNSFRLEARVEDSSPAHGNSATLTARTENTLTYIGWDNANILATCNSDDLLSPVIHFFLIGSTSGEDFILGDAAMAVPKKELLLGMPVNVKLILRDRDGLRLMLIALGLQLTNVANAPITVDTEAVPSDAAYSLKTVCLRVLLDEGSVSDPSWKGKIEPFFECSVYGKLLEERQQSSSSNDAAGQDVGCQCRSKFISLAAKDPWNIELNLRFDVEMLPNTPSDEMSFQKLFLLIACRDAARVGCAEIGWCRFALPWALLCRGRPVDQWITFTPTRATQETSNLVPGAKSAGRAKIRIMKLNSPAAFVKPTTLRSITATEANVQPGLGTVVIWLRGSFESRAGGMDEHCDLAVATASSALLLPPGGSSEEKKRTFSEIGINVEGSDEEDLENFHKPSFSHWGSLPVPGGLSTEITLNVALQGNIVPFSSAFSVMQTVGSYDGSSSWRPALSHLELTLTDNLSGERGARKTKKPPKLLVDASFVPFVSGSLMFSVGDVKMLLPSATRFSKSSTRTGAFRYVLSSHCFAYSQAFSMKSPEAQSPIAGATVDFNQPNTATNSGNNTIALNVNTLTESAAPGECSFEVQVYLVDVDCADANNGSEYCIGVGVVQTAPLYYLALRNAASSSMPKANANTVAAAGVSPWMLSQVNIIDPLVNQVVAVASISAQFILDKIVEPVQEMLKYSAGIQNEDAEGKARAELGLKQTFIMADSDGSGNVSRDELLKVMKNATTSNRRPRSLAANRIPVGMEDVVSLLRSLAGSSISPEDIVDENQLNVEVRKIFKRLDVDGDGNVSWWEWLSVLSAALNGRNPQSTFVDPFETLAIGTSAAIAALQAHVSNKDNLASQYVQQIPFLPIRENGEIELGTISNFFSTHPAGNGADDAGKTVDRLQSMVKSLRVTNSTLNTRLENAIKSSTVALSRPATLELDVKSPDTNSFDRNVSYFNLTKNQSSASPFVFTPAVVKSEKESALELEISRLKALLAINNQMKTDKDVSKEQKRLKLEDEVGKRKEELEAAQNNRNRKMHAMVVLITAIRRFLIPKYRKKVYLRNCDQLSFCMRGLRDRHKYLQLVQTRENAAKVIQRVFRGYQTRQQQLSLVGAANRIQKVFRGKRDRQSVQDMREAMAEVARTKSNVAATRIQSAWRKKLACKHLASIVLLLLKQRSATRIQALIRGKHPKMMLKSMKQAEREKKEQMARLSGALMIVQRFMRRCLLVRRLGIQQWNLLQEKSATSIQRFARGHLARRHCQEVKTNAERTRAAIVIQSAQRGRSARKFVLNKRKVASEKCLLQQEFVKIAQDAVLRSKPPLGKSKSRIVRFNFCTSETEDGASNTRSEMFWGRIADENPLLRILLIHFYHPLELVLFPQEIPYDHPHLLWFALPGDDDYFIPEVDNVVEEVAAPVVDDEEEYRKKQIIIVQRCIRGRLARLTVARKRLSNYWTALQGLFRDSITNTWIPIEKPSLEGCPSCFIRIYETHLLPNKNANNKFRTSLWGRIQAVNLEEANLILEIFDPNLLSIYIRTESYNNPALIWYRAPTQSREIMKPIASERRKFDVSTPGGMIDHMVDAIVRNEIRDDTIEAKETEKPGIERVADGYYISYSIHGSVEKCGHVRGIDGNSRMLSVGFYCDGVELIEQVPYDHPFLIWYKESSSTATRPRPFRPRLDSSVGFEVGRSNETGQVVDKGKIVSFQPVENTITVRCIAQKGPLAEANKEKFDAVYDFNDINLVWMHSMRYYSKITRPPLHLALGCTIYSKAYEHGTRESDFYVGIVHSVNIEDATLTIRYERDEQTAEPVAETVSYDSPDIAWMQYPQPAVQRSLVDIPLLEDSVGYTVEVESNLPEAEEGDFFQGIVVGINQAKNQILIRFSSVGADLDVEWFLYNSSEIAWVSAPELWLASRVSKPELKNAVGYGIALRNVSPHGDVNDFVEGVVKSVDQRTNTFTALVEAHHHESFPQTRICNFDSKDVAWMTLPVLAKHSLVEKPDFVDAIGYTVDIKHELKHSLSHNKDDAAVPQHKFTRGIVVALQPELMRLVVRTISTEDGKVMSTTNKVLSYNSELLFWMAVPPKPITKSEVARPAKITDSIGYVVEVPSNLPNAEYGDYFRGEVVSVAPDTGVICVNFDHCDCEEDDSDVAQWKFNSDKIIWISSINMNKKSAVPRPATLHDAIGYAVCVRDFSTAKIQSEDEMLLSPRAVSRKGNSLDDQFNTGRIKRGIIVAVMESSNELAVRTDDSEMLIKPFLSENVLWMAAPQLFIDRSRFPRPKLIQGSIGCRVEVKSTIPGAAYGDYFAAVIASVDVLKQAVNLRYQPRKRSIFDATGGSNTVQIVCDSPASLGQPLSASFLSQDIAWINPPVPASQRCFVPKPANIMDSVGYSVQVSSNLPGAEEGDFFSGIVSSADGRTGFIYICFDSPDNQNLDIERISFDSNKISWIAAPPTLSNVVGCRVGVREVIDYENGVFCYPELGFVAGVIPSMNEVVCVLNSKGTNVVRNFVIGRPILPFDWLSVPNREAVEMISIDKPSLTKAVGRIIHIPAESAESHDTSVDESAHLAALVVGIEEKTKKLIVRFTEGDEMDDVEDVIPYAGNLLWSRYSLDMM